MTIAPAKKERGRPSTAELGLTPKLRQALTLKAQGLSWKDCAAGVGTSYKTLREWVRNSPEAEEFLQLQQEENQENLNKGYSMLMAFAPEAAEKMIEMIRSDKTRDYVKKDLLRDYFGVIEKGVTERQQQEMLQGMMEKLQALEGGRVLDI